MGGLRTRGFQEGWLLRFEWRERVWREVEEEQRRPW